MEDSTNYLDGDHRKYNMYEQEASFIVHHDYVIRSGVHRAVRLFQLKVKRIPVLRYAEHNHGCIMISQNNTKVCKQYFNEFKDKFPEWYAPLDLGEYKIPRRTMPTFLNDESAYENDAYGKKKWDLIIKKNLPDLRRKVVSDVGSSTGIFSLEMARLGARRVDGFDRGLDDRQPNNLNLGIQSVPQQAYFVRNLYEFHYKTVFNHVNFYECDLFKRDFKKHKYDLFFCCCLLYHFGGDRMEEIIRDVSINTPEIFLQANNGHTGELGKVSCLDNHVKLVEKYGYKIKIDEGYKGYNHPIVYGVKDV